MASTALPPEFDRVKLPWCFRGDMGTAEELQVP